MSAISELLLIIIFWPTIKCSFPGSFLDNCQSNICWVSICPCDICPSLLNPKITNMSSKPIKSWVSRSILNGSQQSLLHWSRQQLSWNIMIFHQITSFVNGTFNIMRFVNHTRMLSISYPKPKYIDFKQHLPILLSTISIIDLLNKYHQSNSCSTSTKLQL